MRIERRAAAAAARLADRIAETAQAELGGGVTVERSGDGVMLTGVGLRQRRMTDARLRDLAQTAVRT